MKWTVLILSILPLSVLGQGNKVKVILDTADIEVSEFYLECSDSTKKSFDSSGSALLNVLGPMTCILKTSGLTRQPKKSINFISLGGNKMGAITGRSLFIGPALSKPLVFNHWKDQEESVQPAPSDSNVQAYLEPIASELLTTNRFKIKKAEFIDFRWRRSCWAYAPILYGDGLNISVINRNILYRLNAFPFEGLPAEYENYDQPKAIW